MHIKLLNITKKIIWAEIAIIYMKIDHNSFFRHVRMLWKMYLLLLFKRGKLKFHR